MSYLQTGVFELAKVARWLSVSPAEILALYNKMLLTERKFSYSGF